MVATKSSSRSDLVNQMKVSDPEMFHSMVKMHLSFLLDLNTDECDCSFVMEKQDKQNKMKKAFTPMKKKSVKGVMDGVPLTQEGVCQVYQIIEYLGRSHNITCEGIFRKHGNLKKQQALKERLNKAVALNLDDDEFSVHECAGVLKNFLQSLPEPLLTDAYYRAHCQVSSLCKESMTDKEKELGFQKQISALQLLFQLIPEVNYSLLKELLTLLNQVAQHHLQNKMNARNLGTIFSTHILCPKKLSPEELQSKHQHLADAVAFMIDHADKLFDLPDKLLVDIDVHLQQKKKNEQNLFLTPRPQARKGGLSVAGSSSNAGKEGSPIVNTVFTFVDREASKTQTNATDEALAALYAHVQSMPESAQKRRLVEKLNQANGTGTPEVATSGSVRTVGRRTTHRQRRKSGGDGFMNLLTPRRAKRAATGSYNIRQVAASSGAPPPLPTTPSLQKTGASSLSVPGGTSAIVSSLDGQKTPARTRSSPALLSPRARLPTPPQQSSNCSPPHLHHPNDSPPSQNNLHPASTPISQTSEVVAVDEVDTPGQNSTDDSSNNNSDHSTTDDNSSSNLECDEICLSGAYTTGEHDGSFIAPPLPPRTPAPSIPPPARTPAPQGTDHSSSPLTNMKQAMSSKMLEAAMTPRSRVPVMVCSVSQLQKWDNINDDSEPAQDNNEIEKESTNVQDKSNLKSRFDVENTVEDNNEEYPRKKDSCRTRSLSSEFKEYLASQGMNIQTISDSDTSSHDDSAFSDSCNPADTSSYSADVRRLLQRNDDNSHLLLSPCMQAIMDGESPPNDLDGCNGPPRRKSPRLSSASSMSSQSSRSTLKAVDHLHEDLEEELSGVGEEENFDPNCTSASTTTSQGGTGSKPRKRRSITEMGPSPVKSLGAAKGNIFFETDL